VSNYADRIARPPKSMTDREVALLLKASGEHRDGFRDHVLYSLVLATGLREHEAIALDLDDVFDADGRARRHVALRIFKRVSDEPARQDVVLSETARAKLEKLLRHRRGAGASVDEGAPLFVSNRGTRLSLRQVRHAFAVWQERAGLERRFSFHALRHTACTGVYRRTKDIRLTQRFARHKSILTTAIYTHPSDDDLVRVVQQLPC